MTRSQRLRHARTWLLLGPMLLLALVALLAARPRGVSVSGSTPGETSP